MICQRCGTEYENEERICPRCQYGKPKEQKPVPKWVPWFLGTFGVLLVVGTVIGVFAATYFNASWMEGSWEGSDLAITFNTTDETFLLSNVETVISGTFTADKDAFTLAAEDGNVYIYRYERVGTNRIKLLFSRGNETMRITLNRMTAEEDELETDDGDSLEDALQSELE
ncbi:MAG: hypothetical protein IJ043_11100 [Clostridia bacterium]|nr:hypothetical protein [Clostridia bacterium]